MRECLALPLVKHILGGLSHKNLILQRQMRFKKILWYSHFYHQLIVIAWVFKIYFTVKAAWVLPVLSIPSQHITASPHSLLLQP